jgi:hypothetical protein
MRVSDLMHTPAVTCAPTSTLCDVGQLMERRQVPRRAISRMQASR